MVQQFDLTARRLLNRADRAIRAQEKLIDAPPDRRPEGKELERARLRLRAARKFKSGIKQVRADLVNEKTEEREPDPRRPQGPPLRR